MNGWLAALLLLPNLASAAYGFMAGANWQANRDQRDWQDRR